MEHEAIIPPPDQGYSLKLILDSCGKYEFKPRLAEPLEQLNTIIELVYANKGVAFIVDDHEALVDQTRAVLIPLKKSERIPILLTVAWRKDSRYLSEIKDFIDFLG